MQILEYVSQLGEAKELTFPPDSAFGKYRPLLSHAVSHPAKMSTGLCEYLINTYTKKGDTIVDPFAGAGTTLIVGALLGRNTKGVELEGHFVKFIEKAIFLLQNTLGEHGKAEIHQGDSRKLSEILGFSDCVITSPPYSEMNNPKDSDAKYRNDRSYRLSDEYSDNPQNIGNLKHGSIDAVLGVDTIITSPPYENTGLAGGDAEKRKQRLIKAGYGPATLRDMLHDGSQAHRTNYLGGKARNTGLKSYDAVITSPPYEAMNDHNRKLDSTNSQRGRRNVGAAYSADAVITSPPYGESISNKARDYSKFLEVAKQNYAVSKVKTLASFKSGVISSSENQIGNLRKDSYLQAVFAVYQECWKILREGGLCIVVVKPFQRNGQIIDLPYQTWLLLQKCGFELQEVLKYRLNALSFWRILQYRKDETIPQLWHEWIIIARKPRGEYQAQLFGGGVKQ